MSKCSLVDLCVTQAYFRHVAFLDILKMVKDNLDMIQAEPVCWTTVNEVLYDSILAFYEDGFTQKFNFYERKLRNLHDRDFCKGEKTFICYFDFYEKCMEQLRGLIKEPLTCCEQHAIRLIEFPVNISKCSQINYRK